MRRAGLRRGARSGTGTGLIGLAERLELAGGTLEYRRDARRVPAARVAAVAGVSGHHGRGLGGQLSPPGEIRVLLVDDDALVRAGLSMMLNGADGLVIVGEAEDGDQVPAAVAKHRPDVVLMDLRMPRVDGIAATRRLRAGAAAARGHRADHVRRGRERARRAARRRQRLPAQGLAARRDRRARSGASPPATRSCPPR